MKTEELVTALSRDDPRPRAFAPTAAVAVATILALVIAVTISIVWLESRADLIAALRGDDHVVLIKLAFTLGAVAAAFPIVRDLSVPGRRLGWGAIVAAIPFVVVIIFGVRELAALPAREWSHHVDGASWLECLSHIPALAFPAFVILAITVRRLAPTNLVRTGAYIGLLSGGIGGIAYALHCEDDSLAFVAVAYTLAIAEMTVLGALAGPRILRWR